MNRTRLASVGALVIALGLAAAGPLAAEDLRRGPRLYRGDAGVAYTELAALVEEAENEVRRLSAVFPWLPDRALRIEVKAQAADSPFAAGLYLPRAKAIVVQNPRLLSSQGRLAAVVAHELVHAALDALGPATLPVWLEEGLAVYFGRDELDGEPADLKPGAGFRELSAKLRELTRERNETAWRTIRGYYLHARRAVLVLRDLAGDARLVDVCRALKGSKTFDTALRSACGISAAELERKVFR